MPTFSSVSEIPVLLICLLLLFAGWMDVRYRVLPNWTALLILILAIGGVVASSGFEALGSHLGHFGLALAIGFGLFALGWIGGGDAKTYAALSAAVPLSEALSLLTYVALAMIVVTVVWIIQHRVKRARQSGEESDNPQSKYAKVPLGVAIAAGGIAYFAPLISRVSVV